MEFESDITDGMFSSQLLRRLVFWGSVFIALLLVSYTIGFSLVLPLVAEIAYWEYPAWSNKKAAHREWTDRVLASAQ